MVVKMNIKKYEGYFHDGDVLNITHQGKNLTLSLHSCEIIPEDIDEKLDLNKINCITGKLHLRNVKKIVLDEKELKTPLVQVYDSGGIIDFELHKNKLSINGDWTNYYPKPRIEPIFFMLEIEFESYEWENLPDLEDPRDKCL